jgi:hypothetical protein
LLTSDRQVAEGDLERRSRRKDDRAFDDVLHLPDVARPGVANQGFHGRGRDGLDWPAHPHRKPLGEMAGEHWNIFASLAQGRQ